MVKISRDDIDKLYKIMQDNDTQYVLIDIVLDAVTIHLEVDHENATIDFYDCSKGAPRRATITKKEYL